MHRSVKVTRQAVNDLHVTYNMCVCARACAYMSRKCNAVNGYDCEGPPMCETY